MKPLIIVHGWSDQASSFNGLAQFFQNALDRDIHTIKLADIVIHSTGALVVREWLTKFYQANDNPVDHLLMLAPANFGSPLAHKGKAFTVESSKAGGLAYRQERFS